MDGKRVLVMICPTFEISGTIVEEIPRSTEDSSEELEKPQWREKVELHEPIEP